MPPPLRVAAAATALAAATLVGTPPPVTAAPADGTDSSDECHEHPPKAPYELHARSANLRSQPSPSAPVLGVVYPGHRIKATGECHGWVRVEDKTSGISGWASTRLIYRDAVMCLDGFVHENGQRFDSGSCPLPCNSVVVSSNAVEGLLGPERARMPGTRPPARRRGRSQP